MGEAKKRKKRNGTGNSTGPGIPFDAPEVKAVLEGGAPINLHLFGLGTVHLMISTLTEEQLLAPEHHAFRRAFETIDKIRTGEIRPWRCGLCRVDHSGVDALSVIAVIERALREPTRDKPALTVPVCHACDSVSTEETKRKIQAALGLDPLQEGRA